MGTGPLYIARGNMTAVVCCRKGWQFLKIIHKIATYLNSTPINTPHKNEKCPSKTCTQMFTVTLFIRPKTETTQMSTNR